MNTEDFKRKLTAVFSADVVGYSRLMGDDEAATVKILEIYKGVMFSLIRQHRGRVVDSPGDNLLAEFGSVVDAVQCAVSIQKELQTRNAHLPENRRMAFRIGINPGDVIEEDGRIYGDGVNIAARIEALADPGGICISKTAFDYIENKLPFGYKFIGDQTVKNIAKPIGAYKVLMETRVVGAKRKRKATAVSFWRRKAVLSLGIAVILAIAAVLYWTLYPHGPSIEPTSIEPEQTSLVPDIEEAPKTIAILPFIDVSPEKDQEYFVDGLSEEILNSICQIPSLTVIARTSSFSFKGTNKTIQEIASVLGVENILEGSVRKAGNALRITAQLVKAVDGSHIWSKTYDRELKDIFEVQEDIATNVADELKVTLGIDRSHRKLGGTNNLEAYEHFLVAKGQMSDIFKVEVLNRSAQVSRAEESLDTAIALDPDFALAWTFKTLIHWYHSGFTPGYCFGSDLDPGLNAALRAIELEPDLPEAYYALGLSRFVRGEFIEAELAYLKARELSPDPRNCYLFSFPVYSMAVGYYERANEIIEVFRQIDPLNQTNYGNSIVTTFFLGGMQRAEEKYEHGKAMFGDQFYTGHFFISFLRLGAKNVVSRDDIVVSDSPIHNVAKEHLDSPKEGLEELSRIYSNDDKLDSGAILSISVWAAFFGDPEFALEVLEKAVSMNSTVLGFFRFPVFQEVRQLPQFKEFIKELGLVDYWNKFGWPDTNICYPVGEDDFVCD